MKEIVTFQTDDSTFTWASELCHLCTLELSFRILYPPLWVLLSVQAADLTAPTDSRVIDHVNKAVDDGINNVSEMQRHVHIFVKSLFASAPLPRPVNRRFYPSRSDLRQMIYRRRRANMHGLLDQDIVANKISAWSTERPDDYWLYRPSVPDSDQRLLLVHQSDWQRRLMLRYGQELVFLDATCKTTQYALPLFFLCVHSNTGYVVVAVMVIEREDSASLTEALSMLRQSAPHWNPSAFMVDSSEVEITAVGAAFPGLDFYHFCTSVAETTARQQWHQILDISRWTVKACKRSGEGGTTACTDLKLYWTKWALAFVCFSFLFLILFPATCPTL